VESVTRFCRGYHRAEFAKVKSQYVPEPFPTWTILDIAGLARPGLIIEIKAVAATKR
jgi:enamine deaminase RidA (YjgF/YER057c/UK114 family)